MKKSDQHHHSVACVVRSARQIEAFNEAPRELTLFLCLSVEAQEYADLKGLAALLLDEEMITSEYRPLNTWALRQTFTFLERFDPATVEYAFFQSNFMYLEGLFTQLAKFCLTFDKILNERPLKTFYVFDENSPLFVVLKVWMAQRSPAARILRKSSPLEKTPFKEKLKKWLYRLSESWVNKEAADKLQAIPKDKKVYLLSGGLNHLRSLALEIAKDSSCQVVFCESAFNFEKFRFCRKNGFIFVIAAAQKFHALKGQDTFFGPSEIVYHDRDLTNVYEEAFKQVFHGQNMPFYFDYGKVSDLFKIKNLHSVLLDEDLGPRRLFLAQAARRKLNCYVISHGVPGIFLEEDVAKSMAGEYFSGISFVQSAFEKDVYKDLLYDPDRFFVTGIPRYDELFAVMKEINHTPQDKIKVLYCGSSLHSLDFDALWPWLGTRNFYRQITKKYTKDILEILSRHPMADRIELKVKPHYNQEREWKTFISSINLANVHWEILRHDVNLFEWEAWADVVLTPESSVICEALLLDKPVIILNYSGQELIAPFNRHGLFEHVRNGAELAKAIHGILRNKKDQPEILENRKRFKDYYAGIFDGQATLRVAEFIMNNQTNLKEKIHEPLGVLQNNL